LETLANGGDISHQHRRAILFGNYDIADVSDAGEQAQGAHIDVLISNGTQIVNCDGDRWRVQCAHDSEIIPQ